MVCSNHRRQREVASIRDTLKEAVVESTKSKVLSFFIKVHPELQYEGVDCYAKRATEFIQYSMTILARVICSPFADLILL